MMVKVAVLDDWQRVARQSADWTALLARSDLFFFHEAFDNEDRAASALADFDILMTMRERTAFPASLVRRLTNLKMLTMTGARATSIDIAALNARGVAVCYTEGGGTGSATAELALGLMIAAVRGIVAADAGLRAGKFQDGTLPGYELAGKTLGVIGLGRLGSRMARYGTALGMKVVAWSQNLTRERAAEVGTLAVSKDELLTQADVVSLHLVLSDRTRGIIGAEELARMKAGAVLINTSRGPLIDEAALVDALNSRQIIAALDVFDREPLPASHHFRHLSNVVLTPHLGYVTTETFSVFYRQSIENVLAFLDGKPVRVVQAPKN
jgi:phosphoglycerate dehydrogenase-like enzyme